MGIIPIVRIPEFFRYLTAVVLHARFIGNNYIFNQIMDKDIGGLEYYLDDSARLNYDYVGKENNQK